MTDEQDGIRFIECKFTVESREGIGGDYERDTRGAQRETRITFDGYATGELYETLCRAVERTVGQWQSPTS